MALTVTMRRGSLQAHRRRDGLASGRTVRVGHGEHRPGMFGSRVWAYCLVALRGWLRRGALPVNADGEARPAGGPNGQARGWPGSRTRTRRRACPEHTVPESSLSQLQDRRQVSLFGPDPFRSLRKPAGLVFDYFSRF
jgi:hypothetical protein